MPPALQLALSAALLASAATLAFGGLRQLSPDAARVRRLTVPAEQLAVPAHRAPLDWLVRVAGRTAGEAPDPPSRPLVDRLLAAGLRGPLALPLYRLAGVAAPVAAAIAGAALAPMLVEAPAFTTLGLFAVGGALAGRAAPGLWLRNRRDRRSKRLGRTLPEALDLLLVCAESGLSIDAALARIGRELAPAAPELAAELRLTAIELGFLPTRTDAWRSLERRAPLPAIRGLVDLFHQTDRYGTPLGQALRVMAEEQRHAALMALEERAARLPAILTIPMVAFILPPLFIVLLGPAVLQLLRL